MYKVQVKYSTMKDGKIIIRKQKWSSNTQRHYCSTYKDSDVDVYAVYCEDVDTVFYIKHTDTLEAKTGIEMRINPALGKQGNNQTIRWAKDYKEFPTTWPDQRMVSATKKLTLEKWKPHPVLI
jgi:hypothetical protein